MKNEIVELSDGRKDARLGKIKSVRFGLVGYNESQLGISFELGSEKEGWGVTYVKAYWDYESIEWTEYCKWSEDDRQTAHLEMLKYISRILKEAKVSTIDHLRNVPVEVTFDKNNIKEFRILTEVL